MKYKNGVCERCGKPYIKKEHGKICESCHRHITNRRLDRIDWFNCCSNEVIRREIHESGGWLVHYLERKTGMMPKAYLDQHEKRLEVVRKMTENEIETFQDKKKIRELSSKVRQIEGELAKAKFLQEPKTRRVSYLMRESSFKKAKAISERWGVAQGEAIERMVRKEYDTAMLLNGEGGDDDA